MFVLLSLKTPFLSADGRRYIIGCMNACSGGTPVVGNCVKDDVIGLVFHECADESRVVIPNSAVFIQGEDEEGEGSWFSFVLRRTGTFQLACSD